MTRKRKAHPQQLEMSLPNMNRNPNIIDNFAPRSARALHAIIDSPNGVLREVLDLVCGSSNSPDVVMRLRRELNLCDETELVCDRIPMVNRDGGISRVGRFRLTPKGRAKLAEMGGV